MGMKLTSLSLLLFTLGCLGFAMQAPDAALQSRDPGNDRIAKNVLIEETLARMVRIIFFLTLAFGNRPPFSNTWYSVLCFRHGTAQHLGDRRLRLSHST